MRQWILGKKIFEIEPFIVHEIYFPTDCFLAVVYDKPVEMPKGKDIIQEDALKV